MSDNSEIGGNLRLTVDKQAAAETAKALDTAKKQTEALNGANSESAKAAQSAAKANKLLNDSLQQIQRNKALDDLAQKYGKAAKEGGDLEKITAELEAELKEFGASSKEVDKVAAAFDKVRTAADAADDYESRAKRVKEAGADFSGDVASSTAGLRGAVDVFSGGQGGAVSSLLEVGEALADVGEFAPLAVTQITTLAATLGPAGIGLAAVAALAAVAVAALAAEQKKQSEIVNAIIDANKDARTKVIDGATTDDIEKEIERLNQLRQLEADQIAQNAKLFEESFMQDGFVDGAATLVSTLDDDLAASTANSTKAVQDYGIQITALQATIDDGSTAINDMIALEKKLAEERTKSVLEQANAAGQELEARQRALNASVEQNEQRLKSIEEERAVIQAQLDSLESSGDTSEEVTAEIERLNAELGALGKESSFISDTALAVAKQREAEKKAAEDAKKAAEEYARVQEQADQKRLQAGRQYAEKLIDIARGAADKAEDALRGLEDALTKNDQSFTQDINKISVEANRARLEAEIAVQEEEARDAREHARRLEAIHNEALSNEEDALRKRNFLEASRIREQAVLALEAESQAFEVAQSEKDIVEEQARGKELRELENARNDRLAALQQQNADARAAYDQRLRDDAIAEERAQREARIARDREIAAANELANSVTAVKQAQADMELSIAQQLFQGIAVIAGQFQPPQLNYAGAGGNRSNTNVNNSRSIGNLNMPFQTNASPAQMQQLIVRTLGDLGFVNPN
jgi:hypothetical protein